MNQNGFFSPYTWMFLKEYAWQWGIESLLAATPAAKTAGTRLDIQTVSETGMGGVSGRDDDRICGGSCALYIQERIQSFYLL